MQLYVLDRAKNTLATTSSFYSDKHHKELTAGASIFEFTIDKSDSAAQYMTTGNYLVFLDDRGRAWSFTILSYDETQTTKTVAAEDVSIELLNKAMDIWNTDQAYPFSYYFNLVTKDTPWKLGVNQLTDLSRKLVYTGRDTGLGRLLSVLKGFDNAECQFNIKVQQNKPVEFTVDVYKSIGTVQDNIQIVYNNELADIKKTESRAQFVTALAGIGGLVENQATTDPGLEKHIDFADIDYKDDNFVSPKGDKFLRAVTANRTFNPGTTTYIEDFYDYDTQSAQELLNRTLTQLKERSEPQYTYDADVKVIDPTLDIGDTVTIIDHDYNPALYLQARVATLDKSYTDPTQGAITFCNYRVLNSNLSDQLRAMQNIIDQLPTSASIKVINNNIVQMITDNAELKKQVALSFESANGKSRIWFSKSATAQDGDVAFIKNADGATEIWKFVEGEWKLDTGLATFEDVKKAASAAADAGSQAVIAGQQASAAGADAKSAGDFAASAASQSTIETAAAKSAANSAVNQANLAISQAGFANDAADQAKTAAANAQTDAATALSGTSLAQQDATKALASAQAALTSVTAANDTANRADSSASAAQASAQAAIKSAQTVLSMASGADAKAEAAAKVATTADSNATDALSGANIALDSAATALNQAISAGSAATSTAIIAKSNQSAISTLATKASVNTLTSQVASTATLQKQTADELLSKADSSVVDSLTSTANSTSTLATQTATALKSKAEISTVNTVNSTATSAATLATQTATTLKSKADSTIVDKLTGRVSSAESKLTQTATKAELALTQNDIDDLGDTVSSQGVKLAATATAAELAATQDNVDTLKKTVTNNTAGMTANAKQIALKANQTDVDTLKGTVTSQGAQVAVTASQVALKADTATVNNLGKTVASQGAQLSLTATEVDLEAAQSAVDAVTKTATSNAAGIATNANAIKLKADSSTVSTLDGRVTSLSGQLDVQSDLISAKVTASDVTGMLNGYATQSWSQGQISAAKNEITASVQNITSDMATQTWTQGKLDLTAEGFTSQISSVQNGLNEKYTSLEQTLSGVQVTANNAVTQGQLTLLSDQFTSTISGMSVGGTNLIPNSSTPQVLIRPDQNMQYPAWAGRKIYTGLKNNETYTFSALATAETTDKSAEQWGIRIFQYSGNHQAVARTLAANTGKRQSVTFTTPDDGISYDVWVYAGAMGEIYEPADLKVVVTISDYKLETGTLATDWSPAPEDQATVADVSSQITQLQSDINLRVKTGDLVSQIDVNAKRILLDGASTYITNTTHIDTGVIKTAMIADAAINNGKIANAAIDNAKIANASITAAKIADLAVGSAQIADGAISTAKIGTAAITSAQIADASILDAKIVNLDGSKIVAHSITADQLDVNAIAVGLNTYGSGWQITPASIAFLPVGTTHTTISLSGDMGITYGDLTTGEILGHTYGTPYNTKAGMDWFNGISTVLKYNGADYWAVLSEESDSTVRPRLTYSNRRMAKLGVFQGWTFDDNTHFATIGPMDSDNNAQMKVVRLKIGDRWATGFKNSNTNAANQSGIAFTDDGATFFGRSGVWWNLYDILKKQGANV